MGGLHVFTLAGVPVFVSVWYFALVAFFAMRQGPPIGAAIGAPAAAGVGIVVGCVTLSLLAHEFGHAMVARRLGLGPRVLLHGWGGLCAHQPARRDRESGFIVAAGPAAGLVLALVAYGTRELLLSAAPALMWSAEGGASRYTALHITLDLLVMYNWVWSLLNLIPLWPLDGGQLLRLGMLKLRRPQEADRLVHQIGIGLAGVGVAYALSGGAPLMALIAGLLGWENYQRLDLSRAARRSSGARRAPAHEFATALLAEAEAALQMEDWREAARLAYQLRDQAGNPEKFQRRALEIIVVANVAQGEHQEALDFGSHAPDTPAVREALAKARAALGQAEGAPAAEPDPDPGSKPAEA